MFSIFQRISEPSRTSRLALRRRSKNWSASPPVSRALPGQSQHDIQQFAGPCNSAIQFQISKSVTLRVWHNQSSEPVTGSHPTQWTGAKSVSGVPSYFILSRLPTVSFALGIQKFQLLLLWNAYHPKDRLNPSHRTGLFFGSSSVLHCPFLKVFVQMLVASWPDLTRVLSDSTATL